MVLANAWTRVIHHGRKWPRVNNHMDARHCPECALTVHGNEAQRDHLEYHEADWEYFARLEKLLTELCKRTGIAEEQVTMPWNWTAVVEGQDAIDSGEEAGDDA